MRLKLYNSLVNKQPGISQRYHKAHDKAKGLKKPLSWLYLLGLNFAFYVLQFKWLGRKKELETYEQKKLNLFCPESQLFRRKPSSEMAEKLMKYDVISFDIFDTMIFRPFSEPTDLFYIMGQEINYMDFKRIRVEAEIKAREKKFEKEGSYEVSILEIWEQLEAMTGIDKTAGAAFEIQTEFKFCYANPYVKEIYEYLHQAGKHIVITSDMYLPSKSLARFLNKCGYTGYEKLYVSNELNKSKAKGDLYQLVKSDFQKLYGDTIRFAHVGDNEKSDVKEALDNGFDVVHYDNVNTNSDKYRPYDMSPAIGGAYRGLVNNRIYNGKNIHNFNQEFGYIYGGLFIVGYCNFIHSYSKSHGIDKILFLSRDGEILKTVYDFLYPDDDTEYVYISRFAALKWAAPYMKYDYLRKLIYHKVGYGKTLSEILGEMELEILVPYIKKFSGDKQLTPDTVLTTENVEDFVDFINICWNTIIKIYKPQVDAAGQWYRNTIGYARNALAVDIGWAGSSFMALKLLFENRWDINCKLTGMVAGTNSANSAEPDMSETMVLDGSLVSYLFSSQFNRDLWKRHNPTLDYNLYFELLTSSTKPSFKGFYFDSQGQVELKFSEPEKNPEGIEDIWKGIIEFVTDYEQHFNGYDFMFNISGRDAYAPMILATGRNRAYIKKIYKEFDLQVPVK